MHGANSRNLELTILSGESLSLARKRLIKKNAYVVIKTGSDSDRLLATAMDTDNGSHPFWSQKFLIGMPMHVTFFTLEVRCRNSSGDHLVGSAKVPVSDFSSAYFPSNYLHFLSYRLRDRYGERNGIINVSVKTTTTSLDNVVRGNGSSTTATGWKYGGATLGRQGVPHGTVIGVPFGY